MRNSSTGKTNIGAWVGPKIQAGIDLWLSKNPRLSQSDFLIEACVEKLRRLGIEISDEDAFFDGRVRKPKSIPPTVNASET